MDSGLPDAAELQKQRLVAQAEELRKQKARDTIDPALAARLESFQQEQRRITEPAMAAVAAKTEAEPAKPQPPEHEEKREARPALTFEPIRDASERYTQALGMTYNMLDPYGSLSRAAMAENVAFHADRERLDKLIAQAADPTMRKALELRKDIEKADYVALTSDRIAQQSYIITGNKATGSEFDKFTKQAVHNRERATELRQQWGALTQREPERAQSATAPKPTPQRDQAVPANDQEAERQRAQDQQRQQQRHRGMQR